MASNIQNDFGNSHLTNYDGQLFVNTTVTNAGGNVYIGHSTDDQRRLLESLPYASTATFNSYERQNQSECLPDTRTALLDEIMAWARGPTPLIRHKKRCRASSSSASSAAMATAASAQNTHDDAAYAGIGDQEPIYWLDGMAGTGKSTIARTVARRCHDDRRLGASFFFSRGGGELETARKFVTTVAVQLARRSPPLRRHICDALRADDDDVAHLSLSDQWQRLVTKPFAQLGADALDAPLVLVVDALDECQDAAEIDMVLRLLCDMSSTSAQTACGLRVFLTSRPEIPVRIGLADESQARHRHIILHHVDRSVVDRDLMIYFRHALGIIRREACLPPSWPAPESLERLVQRAGGLFIWAAVTCRYVRNGRRFAARRLDELLKEDPCVTITAESALDEMYLTVLRSSTDGEYTEEENTELHHLLRTVLGSIVSLFSSLAQHSLGVLLGIDMDEMASILSGLHSILDVPNSLAQPIRLHHASFRDFLFSKGRCRDVSFYVEKEMAHMELAQQCLRLMDEGLQKDICDLRFPGASVTDVSSELLQLRLPPHLRYACLYWAQHVRQSCDPPKIESRISNFMRKHTLHWIEALSLLGRLSEARDMLALLRMTKWPNTSALPAFLADAERFVLYHGGMIEEAPLQIYVSALVFSPTKSILRQTFSFETPGWITPPRMRENGWSCLQTLEGHTELVTAVAFSPDGQLLASASHDRTVRLWHVQTGASGAILPGHTDWVVAVAFSPDGQLLASVSGKTVTIWDAQAIAWQGILEGHSGHVTAVAFTPDSQLLASASIDRTVRLWDSRTGALRNVLEGHFGRVNAVVISPDGHLIVSASDDRTVRLWDVQAGTLRGVLEGHSLRVRAVAVSPDSQLIASASDDTTVILWDVLTGFSRGELEGHSRYVDAVAFSPDGRHLASASGDNTVGLWDVKTGAQKGTLVGHTAPVMAVAFSPDGLPLASASWDGTVRLWDVQAGSEPEGHSGMVTAVTFSPDGQLLASASRDNTVRLWNAQTEATQAVLRGHTDWVKAVAFSPDGLLLASASDFRVRLWDVRTGAPTAIVEGDLSWVLAVAFAPDSRLLATVSSPYAVMLWDVQTGALQRILRGRREFEAVAFSPDGHLIAAASDGGTVSLWDVQTGASRDTLDDNPTWVKAVACSPAGRLLTLTNSLALWEPGLGAPTPIRLFRRNFPAINTFIVTDVGANLEQCEEGSTAELPFEDRHNITITGPWLSVEGSKLMWLPHEYRPGSVAGRYNTVAIGSGSGRVIMIRFDFRNHRPWEGLC